MAEPDRDTTTGRFKPKYPDTAFLDAVAEHEPAATSEVADAVGIARRNAHYRLEQLAEADQVAKKKVGNSLVWTLTTEDTA